MTTATHLTRAWIDGKQINCVGVRVQMYQSFIPMDSIGYYYPDRNWSWYGKALGRPWWWWLAPWREWTQKYSWKITGKDKLGFDTAKEVVPEIRWVVDFPEARMDEDGEEYPEEGHYETVFGEHIVPGLKWTGPIQWREPGLKETEIEIDAAGANDLTPLMFRDQFEVKVEVQGEVFTFPGAIADELRMPSGMHAGSVCTLVCLAGEPKQELIGKGV